jgi:hypothetical protein
MVVKIVPPREPFVDPQTGLISRIWFRFLQDLFTSTGSTPALPDFDESPAASYNVETLAILGIFAQATEQQPVVNDLAARVAELEKAIGSLRVGTVVL